MNPVPEAKTLVIDGIDVSASSDQTILDAARGRDFDSRHYATSTG